MATASINFSTGLSNAWSNVATLRFVAAVRNMPGISGQEGQAAPGSSAGSYGATAAHPQPTESYPQPDDGGDNPAE